MILGDLDIAFQDDRWPDDSADYHRWIQTALAQCKTDTQGRPAELSLILSDNATIQALNRDYRGKDKPTNVLSFPTLESPAAGEVTLEPGPLHLGDIILSYDVVAAEAEEQGCPLKDHLAHLVIHGALHLIGFDHIEAEEAEEMEALEISLLANFGIANPYTSEAQ